MIIGKVKDVYKHIVFEKRQKIVSDIKLKNLILKSNKSAVVNFALNYISQGERYELISNLITFSKDYICPINKREYLEKKYDMFYSLAEEEYFNNEPINYSVAIGQGFPYGFDEFIDVIRIADNHSCIEKFIYMEEYEKSILPIKFMLNCRVEKSCLDLQNTEFAALCLLQAVYIEELNKLSSWHQRSFNST